MNTPDEPFNPDNKPEIVENEPPMKPEIEEEEPRKAKPDLDLENDDDEKIEEVEGPQPGGGEESGHA